MPHRGFFIYFKMAKQKFGDFTVSGRKPEKGDIDVDSDMRGALCMLNYVAGGKIGNYRSVQDIEMAIKRQSPMRPVDTETLTQKLIYAEYLNLVDVGRTKSGIIKYSINDKGQVALGIGERGTFTEGRIGRRYVPSALKRFDR